MPSRGETKSRILHSDSAVDVATASNFRHIRIIHYHLDLHFDFDRKKIQGKVVLNISCLHDCPAFILDSHETLLIQQVVDKSTGVVLPHEIHPFSSYGTALHIPHNCQAGQSYILEIGFITGRAPSLNWLEPEQTAGKEKPYFYCVGFSVTNRSLFPCTDTPAVKATYSASVKVPDGFVAVMSAGHREDKGDGVFHFRMDHPIATYLIALAVGDIVSEDVGPRSKVWTEPCMIDKAYAELFGAVEMYIKLGEKLFGPYVWGKYDILVMPPSFPFGGMENPCLTFVTPCILVGDRSLLDVIMHEITHSWFGNLVTNANWSEFWLNEGLTMYGQRCICAELHGEAYTCLEAATGRNLLKARLEGTGETHPLNRLRVTVMKDIDPDDTYNEVPYEKGYSFASYLEHLAGGREIFTEFLKHYCKIFKYKSLVAEDLLDLFLEYFPHLKDEDIQNRKGFEFKKWLCESGWPPFVPDLSAGEVLMKPAQELCQMWLDFGIKVRDQPPGIDIAEWKTYQILHFLDIFLAHEKLPEGILPLMSKKYAKISETHNAEIRVRWSQLTIRNNYAEDFPNVETFLKSQAKQKYSLPVYTAMWRGTDETRKLAKKIFQETQKYLHINVRRNIERILSF